MTVFSVLLFHILDNHVDQCPNFDDIHRTVSGSVCKMMTSGNYVVRFHIGKFLCIYRNIMNEFI